MQTESLKECLKGTYQWSGTLYQNICDGSTYFVANGFFDYSLGLTFLGIGLILIYGFIAMIIN